MATIIITGGTGMIGKKLTEVLLEKGHSVIVLTRDPDRQTATHSNISYAKWDITNQAIDSNAIARADYIIHLAGAGVADKRWSKKRKQEIIDSRVDSGKLISDSLRTIPNKVKAVVSASAIGWYGADNLIPSASPQGGVRGSTVKFTESDPADDAFLGQTCKHWEESIEPLAQLDIRLVKLRIGIVLSRKGGALKEFLKPLRFRVAAILGSGKQIISWIHIDDLVNMFVFAIENEKINGVYNAVAPFPVSNKELTITLAKASRKHFIPMHIPTFLLKIMLGEMSIEVLKSTTVSCDKIIGEGFVFKYPEIDSAIKNN
ncbi:MAG: TIGR01777 family oxidoreductase [Chitinophagaceae bacterium]